MDQSEICSAGAAAVFGSGNAIQLRSGGMAYLILLNN